MIEVSKKFSKQIIKVMFITIICFVAAIIACNIFAVTIQSELIIGFFGVFGGEFGFLAFIKTQEKKQAKGQLDGNE